VSGDKTTTLVTGGAGFIGSHVVDALLDRGDRVVVVDDLSTGSLENLEDASARGITFCNADIRDFAGLRGIVETERPSVVYHLAAQADVSTSVQQPDFDAGVNVVGTLSVLEAARHAGVSRVVFASTGGGIYGDADELPTTEDAPPRPMAPYGQGKLAAEGYCDLYARLHGLSTFCVRYANIYGPRQSSDGEGGVIAIFAARLQAGGRATIYGDGRQTRDFLHVADAVSAMLAGGESTLTGALNVSSGVETSVLELVDAFRECSGNREFEPEHTASRPGEVAHSCLDSSRARAELGCEPSVVLRDGLRTVLESVKRA
jgi:UDP-glucose 4-epimerase